MGRVGAAAAAAALLSLLGTRDSAAQCATNATVPGLCTAQPFSASSMPLGVTGDELCARVGGACSNTTAVPTCCLHLALTTNDLKGLPPLPKPHYSWPIPDGYLNASHAFLDGLIADFVRITGGCSISVEGATQATVETCVQLCQASRWPGRCIGLNYSPYFGRAPHYRNESGGRYPRLLASLRGWLHEANRRATPQTAGAAVGVGALLLDSETIDCNTAVFPRAVEQLNYIYDASVAAFPDASVEWYNRGGVAYSVRRAFSIFLHARR